MVKQLEIVCKCKIICYMCISLREIELFGGGGGTDILTLNIANSRSELFTRNSKYK